MFYQILLIIFFLNLALLAIIALISFAYFCHIFLNPLDILKETITLKIKKLKNFLYFKKHG